MSVNYAQQLSPYPNKGKCGKPEYFDPKDLVYEKSHKLFDLIQNSKKIVVMTGAGISTSCGIPDFRGPQGVWTLEKQIKAPSYIDFTDAIPSTAHCTLAKMEQMERIHYLISQNVDGLHIKSGFSPSKIAEIHGNVFVQQCHACKRKYLFDSPSPTLGLKFTGKSCQEAILNNLKIIESPSSKVKPFTSRCRGKLKDTVLDWEDELPRKDLDLSYKFTKNCDLFICLGTSLQIFPCGNFPRIAKKHGAKVVIINLQKTRCDKICDLRIFAPIDDVMEIISTLIEKA